MRKHLLTPKHTAYVLVVLLLSAASISFARNGENVESQLKMRAGDERGNEVKAIKTEILVSKSESLAMSQLEKLLAKYKRTPMEPELWFRKAELYMRQAKTARFFELNRDSETAVRLAPTLVKSSEKQPVQNAVAIYEKIQAEFRDFDEMDLVYFNNAFARQQLGQSREAEALYNRLTKQFPESSLVPDCYLAMGELSYDRKDFNGALEHFLKIRKYPTARAYPYGLYKAAWAYYNMQDAEHALSQLEEVVAYGKMVHEQNLDAKLDLRKEALNDMTFMYGETRPSSKAVAYFVKQSAELPVEPTILRLGRTYHRHSRFNDVQAVYSEYISDYPRSTSLHLMHNELVQNYEVLKNRSGAVAQMSKMKEYCDRTRKVTPPVANVDSDVIGNDEKSCDQLLTETSHQLASKWHSYWLKNKAVVEYAQHAESAYEIHLSVAPQGDETVKMRYSFAELLFQQNKHRPASEQYALVADAAKDSKMRQDAAHAALVSLEKATNDKWNDRDEATFKRLAEVYRKAAPEGTYMLDIDFKIGFIAYEKTRYDEAAPIFQRIGWKYKNDDKGRKAQDLYLDILNLRKDYPELVRRSKELLAFGGDAKRKDQLNKVYRESYFAQIQTFEDKGEIQKAIAEYKKFADANRESELAPKAWWNATQLLYKANDYMAGAEASYQYYKRFPKEKNAREALVQAAENFENMGQLVSAAGVLETLAREDEKNQNKWLSVAADFYALAHDNVKARTLYKQLATSSDAKLARSTVEKWLAFEKTVKSGSAYSDVLKLVTDKNIQPQASIAVLAKVEALYEQKNFKEAFNEAKKLIGKDEVPKSVQAKARLIQAQVLDEEFRAQSVKAQVERLATVLALKTEKLDKAQRAYQAAISYGDPTVSIQAVRKLAQVYDHYSKSIRSIELPVGTPAADVAAFKQEMDNLALPMEDKAVDALNEGLRAAKKSQLYDGAVADLQNDLNRMNQRAPAEVSMPVQAPLVVVPTFAGGFGL